MPACRDVLARLRVTRAAAELERHSHRDLAFEHRMYLSVGGFAALTTLAAGTMAMAAPRTVAALGVAAAVALGWLATDGTRSGAIRYALDRQPRQDARESRASIATSGGLSAARRPSGMRRVVVAEIEASQRMHPPTRATPRADRARQRSRARRPTEEALAASRVDPSRSPRPGRARRARRALMQLARPEEAVPPLEMAAAMIEAHSAGSSATRSGSCR
jgi:hypothetical protein